MKIHKLRHIKATEAEMIVINFVGKTADIIDIAGKTAFRTENLSDRIFDKLIKFMERFERQEK